MPNHCENDLIVSGKSERVDECLQKYFTKHGTLDCNRVLPYPIEYAWDDAIAFDYELEQQKAGKSMWEGRPQDGYNKGGYEWCVANWGTKWGTYDGIRLEVIRDTRAKNKVKAYASFLSAWSPPTGAVRELAAKFPDLTFVLKSYEGGAGYRSYMKWKDGDMVSNREYDYSGRRGG